jgi:hypothetical protein
MIDHVVEVHSHETEANCSQTGFSILGWAKPAPQFVTRMAPEHVVTITLVSQWRVRTGKQNKDAWYKQPEPLKPNFLSKVYGKCMLSIERWLNAQISVTDSNLASCTSTCVDLKSITCTCTHRLNLKLLPISTWPQSLKSADRRCRLNHTTVEHPTARLRDKRHLTYSVPWRKAARFLFVQAL